MLQHDRVEPMIYTQRKKLILCNFYKYYLFQSPKYGGLFYVYLINILSKNPKFQHGSGAIQGEAVRSKNGSKMSHLQTWS